MKEFNVVRSFDDELSLSSFVSSHSNNVAVMVYSILVNAFDDVVCIPITDAPADFHKIYLMSRNEPHSKIVGDFIDFMSSYEFPDIFAESRTRCRLPLRCVSYGRSLIGCIARV